MASLLADSLRERIEWRDPGPPPRRTTVWTRQLALLRERPGVWAMLRHYPNPKNAGGTARRLARAHPDFEFTWRPAESGGELFGRLKEGR